MVNAQQKNAFAISPLILREATKSQAYCATDQLHSMLIKESPSYQKKFDKMNIDWQKWAMDKANGALNKSGTNPSTLAFQDEILPVIFHRMVNGAATPITNSITNPQIIAALAQLNSIYAGTAIGSKPTGFNTHIQFCLAQVDNLGNAITTNSFSSSSVALPLDNTSQTQITALSNIVQNTLRFPTTKYINIYLVEDITSPVAGFAYMPSSHGNTFDGIYLESQYILPPTSGPNDLSYNMTVLSHEMGHYLGLFHTFGICNAPLTQTCSCYNDNCLFDGDMICDTPPDFSQAATPGCSAVNTCTTDAAYTTSAAPLLVADVNDLINNYMDYGDWNCQNSFTQGQVNRMHFMIDQFIGPRNSLLHSNVCNATCVNNTCTVSINPITTTTVNGVNLPNTLILSGPTVSYNFTGNTCSAIYNTFSWRAINLATNTTFSVGASGAGFNVSFSAIGNYRIILTSSINGSVPLCFRTSTLDIQVLPPPVCPPNLDMSTGWNVNNWQRTQYDGGWARTSDNGTIFTFPTTTMTTLPFTAPNGVLNTDPFSMVTNLSADPNFSTVPMPAGVTNIMRIGRLITPTTVLPAGDASYVTYTFCPTVQNSKLKVHYLGMREQDPLPLQYASNFASNASGGSGNTFGYVCKYAFNSVQYPGIALRGTTQTGSAWNSLMFNDMMAGGINGPSTSTLAIGTKTFDAMTGWQSSILDFSEFVCAQPTITITFFARSDNASTLGFHHSYSYFAAQCLPGEFHHVDLNIPNKDIACANDATVSCVDEYLSVPYQYYPEGVLQNLVNVSVQQSFDNITFSPIVNYPYTVKDTFINGKWYECPKINLCKAPDSNPYIYYRITYRTLCETIVDTVTIFQGFVHKINDCAPNPMKGGNFISPPIAIGSQTVSPDKYVQYCDSSLLNLTAPCWWQVGNPTPVYKWQRMVYGTFQDIYGATNATYWAKEIDWLVHCEKYRRLAKYTDPYCNNSFWVPSDTFIVSTFKANIYNYQKNIIGPDVCGNSPATVDINTLYDQFSSINCDPELFNLYNSTPATNSISLTFYSNSNCISTYSLPAMTGPSALTFTYTNFQNSSQSINSSFTFLNNGIYNTNGTIYIVATVNQFSCTSTFTMGVTIKIKPSAIAGTITTSPCLSPTVTISGDNSNSTGYNWQYSYNSSFTPTISLSASTLSTTSVLATTFTTFPVYVRRVALGTTDCPNPEYSNTLTINNSTFTLTTSPSVTICAGSSATLTASGASSYTWMPSSSTSSIVVVTPSVTTIYTVTGTNNFGCINTKTVSVTVLPVPTLSISSSTLTVCQGSPVTFTASGALSYTWTAPSFTSTVNPLTINPNVSTVYTLTGQNANGCKSIKTITVTVNPGPPFELTANSYSLCVKGSVTLTASGGAGNTYTWNPGGATTSSIIVSPSSTTIYTVTGFNGSGCTATHTILVTVFPNPVISVTGNTIICAGSTTTLTASGASTYTWNALPSFTSTLNPIVVSPTVTTAGTITGMTAAGCIATKNITITVLPTPTITISGYTSFCAGTTTSLTASGATNYTWMPGSILSSSIVITPTASTIYTVVGSNGSCTSTKTIAITVNPLPIISVIGNTTICAGTSTTFTASGGGGYTWMPGSLTGSIVTVSPTTNTTYTVTGSGLLHCSGTKTISVNVLPQPTVAITGNTFICSGSSTTLTASGGGTYLWSPSGSTSSTITTNTSGIKTVTVTGSNGCTTTGTINVTVGALPSLTITPITSSICPGSSVTLYVSGASIYSWMPGGMTTTSVVVSPTSTTIYTVTGSGNTKYSCSNTITASVIVLPQPTVSITGNTIICGSGTTTLTASGGGTYSWSTGSSSSIINPTLGGVYTVTVTNSSGCKAIASKTVVVIAVPILTVSPITSTICSGLSTTLTASGAFSYVWMPIGLSSYSIIVTPTTTTVYTVTGYNKSGCSSIKTVTVNVLPSPIVTISGSTNFCSGNSGTITASGGGSYQWSNGSTNATIVTNVSINTVTVTSINGCKTVKSVTLTILPTPILSVSSSTSAICAGSCATLTAMNEATVGTAYTWSVTLGGITSSIGTGSIVVVCPTVTTTYTLIGVTKGGCLSSATTSIIAVKNDPSFNIINAQLSGQSYYTSTVTPVVTNANLIAGFGERYIIEEIVLTTSVTVAGTNTNLGLNPNPFCWWVYPNPLTFTGFDGTQNIAPCPASGPYADGQFTNGKAYRITRGTWNNYCPWAQKSRIVYQSGQQFIIADDNSSPDYSSLQIPASASKMMVKPNNLNVYPNPSNGLINIKLEGATETSYIIEIFDVTGSMIFKSSILEAKDSELSIEVDLRKLGLKSGLYMINLKSEKGLQSQRLIVE